MKEESFIKSLNKLLFYFMPAVLLYASVNKFHDYGMYIFIRWWTTIQSGLLAGHFHHWGPVWLKYPLIALAILFNPILPFHFSLHTWQNIDCIAGLLLGFATFISTKYK